MNQVMRKLIESLDYSRIRATSTPEISNTIPTKDTKDMAEGITHSYFWPRIGQWLREYDVVITETGTASFGILETRFPAHITNISQVLYGSIGYSVGALQGAALASKETQPDRRVILFVGDGSLQLTVQEIATIIRHGLKPIIFVINNNGYTIERLIHGMNAGYNDITSWKHTKLLDVFGADPEKSRNYQARSKAELQNLLTDEHFSSAPCIQLVELFMGQNDAPQALVKVGELTAKRNEERS